MHVNNDTSIHEKYVRKLIACEAERQSSKENGEGVSSSPPILALLRSVTSCARPA